MALAHNEKLWYQEGAVVSNEEEDVPKPRKAVKPKLRKAPRCARSRRRWTCSARPPGANVTPAAAAASSGFAFIAPPPGEPKAAPAGFAAFESAPAAPADLFAAALAAPPAAPFAAFGGAKVVSPARRPPRRPFDPFGDSGVLKPTPAVNGDRTATRRRRRTPRGADDERRRADDEWVEDERRAHERRRLHAAAHGRKRNPATTAAARSRPWAACPVAPPPARAPSAPAFAAFGLPPPAVPLSRGASAPRPPATAAGDASPAAASAAAGVVLVAADETQHAAEVARISGLRDAAGGGRQARSDLISARKARCAFLA